MSVSFQELFVGGELSHGEWNPSREDPAKTIQGPAEPSDYQAHLSGKVGLGLVPVRNNGTCRFAALDIDVDTIDHAALRRKVEDRGIPLTVCRSKSGGAHCYAFFEEPGMPASRVRALLKKWAGLLGYPSCEIFPKQVKVDKKNLGNWINLPYFGPDENNLRYAVGPDGALTLSEFLESVKWVTGKEKIDDSVPAETVPIHQMPPCLAALTTNGVDAGARNNALFNFAIFFRKSNPNGWEDLVVKHNQDFFKPPLSNREVQNTIRSAGRNKYQYLCEQEPICSHCDKKACLATPFGVGHMPWKEAGAYDELIVSGCRKILTDPPRYILEVNGTDVELATEEFINFGKFRRRVIELLDAVVRPEKQEKWEQTVRELLAKKEDIEAPKDASRRGAVLAKVEEFLSLFDRTRSRDDLLRGLPYQENSKIMFRVLDLQKFLMVSRIIIDNNELYQILYSIGCRATSTRIKGRVVSIWSIPSSSLSFQTEDFDAPEFAAAPADI